MRIKCHLFFIIGLFVGVSAWAKAGNDGGSGGDHILLQAVAYPNENQLKAALQHIEKNIETRRQIYELPHPLKRIILDELEFQIINFKTNILYVDLPNGFLTGIGTDHCSEVNSLDASSVRTTKKPQAQIFIATALLGSTPEHLGYVLFQEILDHVLPDKIYKDINTTLNPCFSVDDSFTKSLADIVFYGDYDEKTTSYGVSKEILFYTLDRFYKVDKELITSNGKADNFVEEVITCKDNNPGGRTDDLAKMMIRDMKELSVQAANDYLVKGANINFTFRSPMNMGVVHAPYINKSSYHSSTPSVLCFSALSYAVYFKKWDVIQFLLEQRNLNPNIYALPEGDDTKDRPINTIYTYFSEKKGIPAEVLFKLNHHPNTLKNYSVHPTRTDHTSYYWSDGDHTQEQADGHLEDEVFQEYFHPNYMSPCAYDLCRGADFSQYREGRKMTLSHIYDERKLKEEIETALQSESQEAWDRYIGTLEKYKSFHDYLYSDLSSNYLLIIGSIYYKTVHDLWDLKFLVNDPGHLPLAGEMAPTKVLYNARKTSLKWQKQLLVYLADKLGDCTIYVSVRESLKGYQEELNTFGIEFDQWENPIDEIVDYFNNLTEARCTPVS